MKKIIRSSTIPLSLSQFCRQLLESLSENYEVIALSSPGKELDSLAETGRIKTRAVSMARRIAPFSDIKSLYRLIRVLRKENPDIIHSMTPKAGLLSMMAARFAGVPVRVHTFTGLVFPTSKGLKKRILMMCDKVTSLCATHIIAEGEGVRNDLRDNGITKKEIRILGHGNMRGVDLDYFNPERYREERSQIRERLKVGEETVVFIFVGRVVKDKGIEELVNAFRRLRDEGSDVRLLMVGAEEESDKISEESMQIIRKDKDIFFTDEWIEDVAPYYAAANMLVFPSHREGFPNVVLEAGAMKLPAVVTDINGSREIITEGINGCVIKCGDSDALYSAMKSLAEDKPLRERMGERARSNVAAKYERGFVTECHKRFYEEILR